MSKAYEQAGVNIEAGYEAVKRMKSHVERTARKGIMGTFGGFGGMFDLSSLNYKEPVLDFRYRWCRDEIEISIYDR